EDINVNEMYALILGQTSTGAVLGCNGGTSDDAIAENVEDVELRNAVTGQTVDAVSLSSNAGTKAGATQPSCAATATTTSTTGVYRFDDFVLRGTSRWQLRLDFVADIPDDGDRFRSFICSADENDTTGCDFGGFATASTTYNFDADGITTGDKVTDIRPGEDVSGNTMEIAIATLSLTERTIGTTDTVVENAKNVQLLRFEATAGKAEDIFLTQLVLESDSGQLVDASNYTLWVDTDDNGVVDTVLESGKACTGTCSETSADTADSVTFDDLAGGGYTVPAEQTVMFEVHADISGSIVGTGIAISLRDNDGLATTYSFVEAEEADDGSSLSCITVFSGSTTAVSTTSGCTAGNSQIRVTNASSKRYTLRNQGTLYVRQDSEPTRNRQLLAGDLGEAILRLEMRAEDEPVDVTRIIVSASGASITNLDRFQLFRSGEATAFASATLDNCNSINASAATDIVSNSFCAVMESQQLVIQEGDRVDVLVRPLLKLDEQGAVSTAGTTADNSNGVIRARILPNTVSKGLGVSNTTTGTGAITARGFHSSNVLLTNDNDTTQDGEVVICVSCETPTTDAAIVGNKNDTVLAKIVTIEDTNPDADGTNIPVGTNKRVAEFKFTAATNNNTLGGRNRATLSGLVFNIASTNVRFTSNTFDLYNKNDQNQKIRCTAFTGGNANTFNVTGNTASGSFFVDCHRSVNTSTNLEIQSGGSVTLVLEADIGTNQISSTAGSSLSVSLNDFSTRTSTTYEARASTSTT
ncbi:MAG: hypothetical protein AAB853_02455, partial [Patescibacteria group bacterium]